MSCLLTCLLPSLLMHFHVCVCDDMPLQHHSSSSSRERTRRSGSLHRRKAHRAAKRASSAERLREQHQAEAATAGRAAEAELG